MIKTRTEVKTDPLDGMYASLRKYIVKQASGMAQELTNTVCDALLDAVDKAVAKETVLFCDYGLKRGELLIYADLHVSGDAYSSGPRTPLSRVLIQYLEDDGDLPIKALRRSLAIVEKAWVKEQQVRVKKQQAWDERERLWAEEQARENSESKTIGALAAQASGRLC